MWVRFIPGINKHTDLVTQDDSSKRPEMKLNIPETLKVLLVDDWEAVTKNNQVS